VVRNIHKTGVHVHFVRLENDPRWDILGTVMKKLSFIVALVLLVSCSDHYRVPECQRTKNKALSAQISSSTVACAQP
jgi:hypothetical protein